MIAQTDPKRLTGSQRLTFQKPQNFEGHALTRALLLSSLTYIKTSKAVNTKIAISKPFPFK